MDSVNRYNHCAEHYQRFSSGYPIALLEALRKECGLSPRYTIADIGCGSGQLSSLLAQHGYRVIGVEPNEALRAAAGKQLAKFSCFQALKGRAERTRLAPNSVDFITVGQAFHWFPLEASRDEFRRILRPEGSVALIWNKRRVLSGEFMREVEAINVQFGTDYTTVQNKLILPQYADALFGEDNYFYQVFDNSLWLTYEQFRGLMLSRSYLPDHCHPAFWELLDRIDECFARFEKDGRVYFELDTVLYHGKVEEQQLSLKRFSSRVSPERGRVRPPLLSDSDFENEVEPASTGAERFFQKTAA